MTASDIWTLTKRTVTEWSEDKCPRLAAAMALFTMLSLAPMLVITIKVVALALDDNAAQGQVQQQVSGFVGPEGGKAVETMVQNAAKPGEGRVATIVSTILLVIGATALFASIQDALNTIWGVKPKPGQGLMATLRARALSLLLVLGVAALLLGSVVLSNVIQTLTDNIGGPLVAVSYVVDLLLSLAITTGLFALVFKFLPDVVLEWRDVLVGAAVTAVLFAVGKYGLTLYFAKAAPNSAYGAAGSLAALLIWVYYTGMIAFFGAEFTKVYVTTHLGKPVVPRKHAVLLSPADRIKEGVPRPEQVEAAAAADQRDAGAGARKPVRPAFASSAASSQGGAENRRRAFNPTSAAAGAAAAGLAAWYLARGRSKPSRRHVAAAGLAERIRAVEAKVGRVGNLRAYLDRMEVKDRIDRVEHEVQRAGRHVRAKETGRPLWMVRLGDLIGGRWSNL